MLLASVSPKGMCHRSVRLVTLLLSVATLTGLLVACSNGSTGSSASTWLRYSDTDGDSNVEAYRYGWDYIDVRFEDGSVYTYTYESAGEDNVERMKGLADSGDGLNAFINREVKYLYEGAGGGSDSLIQAPVPPVAPANPPPVAPSSPVQAPRPATVPCPVCSGAGSVPCYSCGGSARRPFGCGDCFGGGTQNCPSCYGMGSTTCKTCYGSGRDLMLGGPCPACGGAKYVACGNCGGAGAYVCRVCGGDGASPCSACATTGAVECPACDGRGEVPNR